MINLKFLHNKWLPGKRESNEDIAVPGLLREYYLTIIPRARVGYEMTDTQRGA